MPGYETKGKGSYECIKSSNDKKVCLFKTNYIDLVKDAPLDSMHLLYLEV